MHTKFWLVDLKEVDQLGALNVPGRIILKKQGMRVWARVNWLRTGSNGGLLCTW
jgi:hypothetical protein